jgi:hypothetical protein
MNIQEIDDSPSQIASTTRRHLLAATAGGLITSAATAINAADFAAMVLQLYQAQLDWLFATLRLAWSGDATN